jgi:hypothetical protein
VPFLALDPVLAVSDGEVIMIVVAAVVPIAAIAFALGSGDAFRQIGKGQFSVEFDDDVPRRGGALEAEPTSPRQQEQEIRQLLEAKAYRQTARGETAVDVEAELGRLLAEARSAPAGDDPALREEVRQLVLARNARRLRQGKQPLDVDAEIERQLEGLEDLGG